MKVLLIGGTGVLSSAVTAEAMRRGISVTMINRGTRKIPSGVEVIISNNKNYSHLKEVLRERQFDAVIDFLCYKPEELRDSFELYSKHTKQYFFISSCSVYDTTKGGIYDEDAPKVRKEWPYSVDKWDCECLLKEMAEKSNCRYTVIRPCLTYGDTRLPYGIAPEFRKHWTLVARILAGKPIIRWNEGRNRWNMMRVEDLAVGLVGLIGNPQAYDEAFNICGDDMPSYADVLTTIGDVVGKEPIVVDLPTEYYASQMDSYLAGEIIGGRAADLTCSNAKIKKVVPEFKQRDNLKEGIAKTIEAYRREGYQLGIDWYFDAKTDRLVSEWCKSSKISEKYRISFVDYLGGVSSRDKFDYYRERYRGVWAFRFVFLGFRVLNKMSRALWGAFAIKTVSRKSAVQ